MIIRLVVRKQCIHSRAAFNLIEELFCMAITMEQSIEVDL